MIKPDSRTILICSCEQSMPLDLQALATATKGATLVPATHLCGPELDVFRKAAAGGRVTVACTAQRAVFEAVADEEQLPAALTFVNVRETAGWSSEAKAAGAKMAALLAAATVPTPSPTATTFNSEGVTLIYGIGQVALDAAAVLKDRLDITVLLSDAGDVAPPPAAAFPIRRGRIVKAQGHLGAFDLIIDGYAAPAPSSRQTLKFGKASNGAVSQTDILIDLSGGKPLFSGHDLRAGYLRADPADTVAVQQLLFKAADLVGTFDTPRYIALDATLCAHSRSRKTGCTRCLDLCPVGAITPAGDVVAIDPHICGGCGQCAAVCPTGAAAYTVPAVDVLVQQVRASTSAFYAAAAPGSRLPVLLLPVLLLHDSDHGTPLIDASARFGDGLPATAIPLAVNEVTQIGVETLLAAVAYGARAVRILTRARPRHDVAGLSQTVATANAILGGLGYGADAVALIQTDDPDQLAASLRTPLAAVPARARAGFAALGAKRDLMKLSLRELHRLAPTPQPRIDLPKGAPFGGLTIDTSGCTLCLSCVSACPTSALSDAADRPLLSFDESLCVQCGLCVATCPETVIKIAPRIDFAAYEAGRITVKEEAPFHCITCGTAFGVKSTIDRITAKLKDKHWMYAGENQARLDLIKQCDTCRIEAMTNAGFDPYAGKARAPAKTTEDYLRERDAAERETAMKAKINKGEV
jgi:ferredoxin